MLNKRRRLLTALSLAPVASLFPLAAARAEEGGLTRQAGRLRVAVYQQFAPYSHAGKGIDVELASALAARLGLAPEIVSFPADDDMADDLRNMVWKGHYLGTQPADVMMHVPVDEYLARENDKVRIFGAYHRESLAVARQPARVPPVKGSAAVALEAFTREKIGVEGRTLADSFLLGVLNGRLRDNVVHFKSVGEAVTALRQGNVAAVMAPRAELEGALGPDSGLPVEPVELPELKIGSWPIGLAVKVEAAPLAEALTQALADLKRDGTVAAIFRRHGVTHQPA